LEGKVALFEKLQQSDKIIPLFSKNKIWATDSQFNLTDLFSINGIPYWHQLSFIN
jgi:peptide/nickel transport system substrate-binding protein